MTDWRGSAGKFRYRHSPLIEALCEFGIETQTDWSPSLVEALQAAFQRSYPIRRNLSTFESKVELTGSSVHHGFQVGERVQLVNEANASMIQLAPNTLTVNDLAPYSGWTEFKPRILEALGVFLASHAEAHLARAHLRYINRVELEGPVVELDDWFQFSFRQPELSGLPGASSYLVGAQYSISELATLRVQISSVPAAQDIAAALLDLEVVQAGRGLEVSQVDRWLEVAHDQIEASWLGSITEKLHFRLMPEGA